MTAIFADSRDAENLSPIQKVLIGIILGVAIPLCLIWMVAVFFAMSYAIGSPLAVFMHYVLGLQQVQVHDLEIMISKIEIAPCCVVAYMTIFY